MEPLIQVNGQFQSDLSCLDRGLLYGQGLFETIRLQKGRSSLLPLHLNRLCTDAPRLFLPAPQKQTLEQRIDQLWAKAGASWTALQMQDCTLKILLTGGTGGRGYRQAEHPNANLVLQLFERDFSRPQVARARLCKSPLGASRFAGIKHCNRLEQIAAATELQAGDFEGLLLDEQGFLIEGISSNLLLVRNGKLFTPELDRCGVKGVMRQWLSDQLGVDLCTGKISIDTLFDAQSLYAINSNWGVIKIHCVVADDQLIQFSTDPWDQRLADLHNSLFRDGVVL